jgi:hypothetical protein
MDVDTFKGKINGVGFNPPMESEFGNPITVEDFKPSDAADL